MGRSSGIRQLFKGIFIGTILVLAIIGSMSIFDKNNGFSFFDQSESIQTREVVDIFAPPQPSDSKNSTTPPATSPTSTVPKNTQEDLSLTNTKNQEANQSTLNPETQSTKPTKSNQSGLLQLDAIHPKTKEKLNASFLILTNNNEKVTEIRNTESATFRLPVGQYKVITLLSKPKDAERDSKTVRRISIVTIRANSTTNETIELEPFSNIGVLQVAATSPMNKLAIKADFIIQKENGETIATRNNVSSSLFKLKAGSYKVTVKSGNFSDFRTVVVEPGAASKEIFTLQNAFEQGRVLIVILDTVSDNPVRADIKISDERGEVVQALTAVSRSELSLPSGRYTIEASTKDSQSTKTINIAAEQALRSIFRFDAPKEIEVDFVSETIQITDSVRITGVSVNPDDSSDTNDEINNPEPTQDIATTEASDNPEIIEQENSNTSVIIETTKPEEIRTIKALEKEIAQESTNNLTKNKRTATLRVFAQWGDNKKPLKSNFYVQTPNGKHITKKSYVTSAIFTLNPGTYKITALSNGRPNLVKTILLSKGQDVSLDFASKSGSLKINKNSQATKNQARPIPNGLLSISISPPQRANFIVTNNAGQTIVHLKNVPTGNLKLDVGEYTITAVHRGKRMSKRIQVRERRTVKLNFNASNFSHKKTNKFAIPVGILRSRITDDSGKPLRGTLTVTNIQNKVIARAENVFNSSFKLAAARYKISLNYQGLIGSEMITVIAGKTIEQVFTIATPRQ